MGRVVQRRGNFIPSEIESSSQAGGRGFRVSNNWSAKPSSYSAHQAVDNNPELSPDRDYKPASMFDKRDPFEVSQNSNYSQRPVFSHKTKNWTDSISDESLPWKDK